MHYFFPRIGDGVKSASKCRTLLSLLFVMIAVFRNVCLRKIYTVKNLSVVLEHFRSVKNADLSVFTVFF